IGGKYFIEDKQSRNGTFVNGQAIDTRTLLKNADRIRICDFVAVFLDQGEVWPGLSVLSGGVSSLQAECQSLRTALESNHVLFECAGTLGLQEALADPSSSARRVLGAGFHSLVVLDAEWGTTGGTFDLDLFLRHAYAELVRAFNLNLPAAAYHLENVAQ